MSMSRVRKHFWTDVARGHGATSSPTKNGLKGTMPAMVKSTVGIVRDQTAPRDHRVPPLDEELG